MTQGMVNLKKLQFRYDQLWPNMTKYTILSIFDKEKVKTYDHPDPANMIGTESRGQGFLISNVVWQHQVSKEIFHQSQNPTLSAGEPSCFWCQTFTQVSGYIFLFRLPMSES